MTSKTPGPSKTRAPTKEERLAKALRDNLSRRKALVRAQRERAADAGAVPQPSAGKPERDDAGS
jgi:hypothetical protein